MKMRKMPVGIQDFEKLRTEDYVYVDKTEYVYELTRLSTPFFLGRPRRFGKSLLLSTLRAYFEGKRELFKGLAMERLEKDWTPHPVLHIDLNVASYGSVADLEGGLDTNLRRFERIWGLDGQTAGRTPSARFYDLIQTAHEQSGRSVVVIVDECDRPLLQTMENGKTNDDIRAALKGFYGVLKSADRWLRFVLLTGVTKFSKVSVFSDLNML
ncbi:MAG: AAA family ATPase, partial [Clostridiales Family XIII bacterium]|nr:AAA family ATPase [Clostridiales Family XIII bacterium]